MMFQLKYHRWLFSEFSISSWLKTRDARRDTQKQKLWIWIACKSVNCIVMHLHNRNNVRTGYVPYTVHRHLPPFSVWSFEWETRSRAIIICELRNIWNIFSSFLFPILNLCEILWNRIYSFDEQGFLFSFEQQHKKYYLFILLFVSWNFHFGIWFSAQQTANKAHNIIIIFQKL